MATITGTNAGETLNGTAAADTINGLGGNDQLFGFGANDTLDGGTGNDILDGGLGLDTMRGGSFNDTYIVNQSTDKVIEFASEGIDLVKSTATFTLSANVENLTLIGAANLNGTGNTLNNVITGNNGINQLFGLGGTDTLDGGAGNDTLDGGLGQDTMKGGSFNDTYLVNQFNDSVVELLNQGIDLVKTTASFTLSANVENLTMLGVTGINGTGNNLGNIITGNSGNNILTGLGGDDKLFGGAGNDTLFGGAGNNELHPGVGNDTVNGNGGFAFVSYAELASGVTVDLAAGTTGGAAGTDTLVNILGIVGSSAADDNGGIGLKGGSNTVFINGGGGNDRLFFGSSTGDQFRGDAGLDNLHGHNSSKDGFGIQYNKGADNFFDLETNQGDYIHFSRSEFNVAAGATGFFVANATGQATNASHRLIYNINTDQLFADLDGTGAGLRVLIASIPNAVLTENDFFG